MQRATISVFCIALAVGLTTGSPIFYESARVLNKVEFSDIGVDGDRIDPLIEESEEELRNITVSSHTDISEVRKNDSTESTDTGEQTEPVLKVTVISSNGLPDEEITGAPHISTTKTIEEALTTTETTTIVTPEKTTEHIDAMMPDSTTQLMPKMSTKDIQPKEETANVHGETAITTNVVDNGETSITTNLVDNGETSDVTTISATEEGQHPEKDITSTIYNGNGETSDVTSISPTEDGQNLLEIETTSTILPPTLQQNTDEENAGTEDLKETTLKDFTTTFIIMSGAEQTTTTELSMESDIETTESIVTTTDQTAETMVDTTTSRKDSESYTIITDITVPTTVTTDTDSGEFMTTVGGGASTSTTESTVEASSEEMFDSTVLVTTETIPVTEFVKETHLPDSTTEEMVLSTEPTESATESTVTIEVNITESVTAVETTTVYYSSEIVDRETSMAVSSPTVALTEDIAAESETVTEITETETTTVLQTTLRSYSFTENDSTTITATTDSNNSVGVEAIDTTQSYSTSEFITVTEATETTTSFVEIISSTSIAFSEESTVIVTSASAEDTTSSTFEITTEAISLQTNQANETETVVYDTTRAERVSEDNFQPTSTNVYDILSTAGEAVTSITTDSSNGHMLTTSEPEAQTSLEFATTVGKDHDMLTTTFTEEAALTTTEESVSITTINTIFAEVEEEIATGSSASRSANTANENEITPILVKSTSAGTEASIEEASVSLTVTSTYNDVSQQYTGKAAISSETELIDTMETFTTFSAEEQPSAVALTTETYLPPMAHDVNASDESFISSQLLTQESTDQQLEISSSATITILALVTASPTPSTTDNALGLDEHKITEIFSTESSFTPSVILEETEEVSNEAVVTLPAISEDSDSNAPGTTSPQLKQESSLNALTTPSIESGSSRHGPNIGFSLAIFSLVTLLFYHPVRSCTNIWL
ncbi:serine-rich adhesin for platelets-like [Anopheles marshallii]|uniref:serine-rich adhesin for platelets-like n=1 Tax=Anopheles marshallii TaxID=1521116 RepID=UPI00237AE9CD|nr:serine-rich adhesin for platelets-like [Anopheles marshallii]